MEASVSFEKRIKRWFWSSLGSRAFSSPTSVPKKIKSVLVLRPDRLGDFALSIPALKALEAQLGDSGSLTIVAGVRNQDLARFCFPQERIWLFRKNIFSQILLLGRLKSNHFDAVIDFHSYPFSTTTTLWAALSKAPIRIGFWAQGDFEEYLEVSQKVFNRGLPAPLENRPEVQKSFQLVQQLFPRVQYHLSPLDFSTIDEKTVQAVTDFYRRSGIRPRDPVLGIHPTLQKRDNRWSQEKYVELLRELSKVKGLKVVVLHGKKEEDELEKFKKITANFSNLFTLPSDDLFFILEAAKRFDTLVCNDSGLMHVCAWVTPVTAIFGPSDVKRWGPQLGAIQAHRVFKAKDGLCDSVKPQQVARVVQNTYFR